MTAADHTHVRTGIPEAAAGARAAGLLVDACAAGESLQVRVVRDAALDLQRELNALQGGAQLQTRWRTPLRDARTSQTWRRAPSRI